MDYLCETCVYKNTLMWVINFSETGPLIYGADVRKANTAFQKHQKKV